MTWPWPPSLPLFLAPSPEPDAAASRKITIMLKPRRYPSLALVATLTLTLAAACSGESTSSDAPAPPPATTQPAAPSEQTTQTPPTDADPVAEAWVARIAQRHAKIQSVHARLIYDRIQDLLGAEERRFGSLVYDAGPPGRFAVHIDRLLVDDRLEPQDRWYVFDGRWLIERLTDRRQFLARQVVGPDVDPATQDPLALGRGPFVVPIGPNGQRLLERFDVDVIEPGAEDNADDELAPAATPDEHALLHLRLVPKAHDRTDFDRIDVWYDRETLLPQRVRSIDPSENVSDIFLRDLRMDEPVDAAIFDTTPPQERGWEVEITPWESREP